MIFTIEFYEKDICLYEATVKYPDFNVPQLKEYTPQEAVNFIFFSLFKQGMDYLNPDNLYDIKVSFTEVRLYLKETFLSNKFPSLISAFAYNICEKLEGTKHKKIIHLIRLWDESMKVKLHYRELELTELDNFFKFSILPISKQARSYLSRSWYSFGQTWEIWNQIRNSWRISQTYRKYPSSNQSQLSQINRSHRLKKFIEVIFFQFHQSLSCSIVLFSTISTSSRLLDNTTQIFCLIINLLSSIFFYCPPISRAPKFCSSSHIFPEGYSSFQAKWFNFWPYFLRKQVWLRVLGGYRIPQLKYFFMFFKLA